jgi:NAD(P)-dependent dehydrogenase (short-subunit alcohol dehydrogenase family)
LTTRAGEQSRSRSTTSCLKRFPPSLGASKPNTGGLHILVNDIWGAATMEWNKSVWESSLEIGLRTLRLTVDTHAITNHFAIPLLIKQPGGLVVEVTDGTAEYNATNYRVSFVYDLAKATNLRMAFALAHALQPYGATVVALTPGWLRSEAMREAFGVTEDWRDATARVPTSPSPRVRRSSAGPSSRSREIPTCRAGPERRCRAGSWQGSTASLISTPANPGVEVRPRGADAGKPADTTGYR